MTPTALLAFCVIAAYAGMAQAATLDTQAREEATAFLKKHLQYYNTANREIVKLYRDDADIRLTITQANNQTTQRVMNGKTWLRVLLESWESGRSAPEHNQLHHVTLSGNGPVLEVAAQRYSKARCYWDNHYQLSIEKTAGVPGYQITKETAWINHNNRCPQPRLQDFLFNQQVQVVPK